MKHYVKKIILCIILTFSICALISCTNTLENQNNTKASSELLNDEKFLNSPHLLINPVTRATMVVKGDGKILIRATEPRQGQVGLLEDMRTNECNFIYKIISGEKLEEQTYTNEYNGQVETYTEKLPSEKTIYYDKNGDDLGLEIPCYAAFKSFNNYIMYYYYGSFIGSNGLKIYDASIKDYVDAPHTQVNYFGDHLVFSADAYSDKDMPKETMVVDDNLNPIKTIKDYSLVDVVDYGGVKVGKVMRRVLKDKSAINNENANDYTYDDFEYKYNFIDEDFNLIFDEPTDTKEYRSDKTVVTMQCNGKEFDYDFAKKEKVSADRPIVEEESKWQKRDKQRSVFSAICDEIQNSNDKYSYVQALVSENGVVFQATLKNEDENEWRNKSDFYNINKELLKSVDFVNYVDEDLSRIFVDYDTMYDFNFNVIKKFDRKTSLDKHEAGDKIYYSDSIDTEYMPYDYFTLYDVDFNPLMTDVRNVDFYSIKDKIVIVDDGGTMICDKDLKELKSYKKKMKLSNWYDIPYMAFTDLDTGLEGIVDDKLNVLVDNLKKAEELKKDYFTFQNGFKYGLMDYKGNVLVSYSIFDTMSEDSADEDYQNNFIE